MEYIKNHPELYGKGHELFKNKGHKACLWEKIAANVERCTEWRHSTGIEKTLLLGGPVGVAAGSVELSAVTFDTSDFLLLQLSANAWEAPSVREIVPFLLNLPF